jgi:hypothetical protein
MDYRKLFHVLVVGGAIVGGTACGKEPAPAKTLPDTAGSGANDASTGNTGQQKDAGSDTEPGGGGVQGW